MGRDAPVLVVGAEGLLGGAVAACLAERGTAVLGTTRRPTAGLLPLDLAAPASTWRLPERLQAAVLCAAVTSTAACRSQPAGARRVNVDATVELAGRLVAAGVRVVFPSTNQVFDGAVARVPADAARCPRTAYGRMKAEAEVAVLGLGALATVVRLTKIIHRGMPLFAGWREALGRGQPVQPFADLPLAPLTPGFAAAAVVAALDRGTGGVIQVSATDDVTYADVAFRMSHAAGQSSGLVHPVRAAAAGGEIEHVPLHTTLDTTTLRERLGLEPPGPWAAVDALYETQDSSRP
jgi:dTDP-4-dehydrorhamnose reductase